MEDLAVELMSPDSVTVGELTGVWERVLVRKPIRPDANFFLMGGDRRLADVLFAEIESTFYRSVSSAAIDYAPTIELLSTLLNRPESPWYSPVLLMKHGDRKPPVFLVHGLSGSMGELTRVISEMAVPNAIYGLEAKGIDGLQSPLDRIDDMAALYLESILAVEHEGPYILLGYSLGGLIALDMAQRLLAAGKNVDLTMIDTNPGPAFIPGSERWRLAGKRIQYHIDEMRTLPFPGPIRYMARKTAIRLGLSLDPEDAAERAAAAPPLSFARSCFRVMEGAYTARSAYRPRFYPSRIRYVAAAQSTYFLPHNPGAVWGHLTAELEIETVAGDHVELVRSGARELGLALSRYIRRANWTLEHGA